MKKFRLMLLILPLCIVAPSFAELPFKIVRQDAKHGKSELSRKSEGIQDPALLGKQVESLIPLTAIESVYVPYFSINNKQQDISEEQILRLLKLGVLTRPQYLYRKYSLAPWKDLTIKLRNGAEGTLSAMLGGAPAFIKLDDGRYYGVDFEYNNPIEQSDKSPAH